MPFLPFLLQVVALASAGAQTLLRDHATVEALPNSCLVTSRVAENENVTVTAITIRCVELHAAGPIEVDWPENCRSAPRVEVHKGPVTITVLSAVCVDDYFPDDIDPLDPFGPEPSTGPSDAMPSAKDLPEACHMDKTVADTPVVAVTVVVIKCVEVDPDGPIDVAFPEHCQTQQKANENGPFTVTVITAVCKDVHVPTANALSIVDLPQQAVSPLPDAPFQLALQDGPVTYELTQTARTKRHFGYIVAVIAFALVLVLLVARVSVHYMRKPRASAAVSTEALGASLQPVH